MSKQALHGQIGFLYTRPRGFFLIFLLPSAFKKSIVKGKKTSVNFRTITGCSAEIFAREGYFHLPALCLPAAVFCK